MTTSASVPNEASDTTTRQAQDARTEDSIASGDTLETKPVNALTEALSEVIRGENKAARNKSDLVFGHYAAARWDK